MSGGQQEGTPPGVMEPATESILGVVMRKPILASLVVLSFGIISSLEGAANTFTPTGSMLTTRESHTATLLKDGKVLVVGGMHWATMPGCTIRCSLQLSALASAELYDPATGKFTRTGSMSVPRVFHTTTLLGNGKVLVAGGDNRHGTTYATAELYDPATRIFTLIGNNMTTKRSAHTATRLANGKVLIAGGGNGGALSTAEIFDPATEKFTPTGNMHVGRFYFTATLLSNGRVLVAGGICDNQGCTGTGTSSAELYDAVTGTFARTGSMSAQRSSHRATWLTNGAVLVTGGATSTGVTATAELFHPLTGSFERTGSMRSQRELHTATRLTNGAVLVAGGINGSITLSSAELFEPTSGSFVPTGNMETVRSEHAATLLGNGNVLITGGINTNTLHSLATAELFH